MSAITAKPKARIEVNLVECMGEDLTVVNAARVSFSKHDDKMTDKGKKLINYLADHEHWTPFGHCVATFHIKAPIFVARQIMKHQVGFVVNEVSRRYVTDEPELYWPAYWRASAPNVKQGSSLDEVNINKRFVWGDSRWDDYTLAEILKAHEEHGLLLYNRMLKAGICPEQARMVLPLNTMTEWYMTGSLAAWARLYLLRIDGSTQMETRSVAYKVGEWMEKLFPVSWEALTGEEP